MATIYRCDRCHDDQNEKLNRLQLPHVDAYRSFNDSYYVKELCDSCMRHIIKEAQPLPQEQIK